MGGGRKTNKSKEYEYEVKYAGSTVDSGQYLPAKSLKKMGWEKGMKAVDLKIAQRSGLYVRPLSSKNVEQHLEDCGLERELVHIIVSLPFQEVKKLRSYLQLLCGINLISLSLMNQPITLIVSHLVH